MHARNKMILELIVVASLLLYAPTLNGSRLKMEDKFRDAIEFWTDAMCTVPKTKTIYFHGIFTNGSHTLLNFFDALIRGIGDHCDAIIFSKTYTPDDSPQNYSSNVKTWRNIIMRRRLRNKGSDVAARNNPRAALWKFITRENLFQQSRDVKENKRRHAKHIDLWNINVILVEDINIFKELLDTKEVTFRWSIREHFIILAIWNDKYEEIVDTKTMAYKILKKLWVHNGIQNVIFNKPLSSNQRYVFYSYNPFAKVKNKVWGKLETIDVKSKGQVFYVLSTMTYQRTKNLNGRNLTIGVFEQFPTMMRVSGKPGPTSVYSYSGGYNGTDGIMLGTMAKYMNFKVHAVQPPGEDKYGHQMKNGTYIGAIADVVYRRVDVCFVPFFIKKYGENMNLMEFTTHVGYDRLCVVVPKAQKIPKGFRIYHIFEPSVWFFMILSQIVMYLTLYYIRVLSPRRSEKVEFTKSILEGFFVNAGYPIKFPMSGPQRILLTAISISSMTLTGTFNGILYKCFAKDMYYKDIDRLSDLDKTGLPVSFSSFSVSDIFGENNADMTPLLQSLKSKLVFGKHAIKNAAYHRNVSALLREYSYPLIRETLVDKDGSHLVHLTKECPARFYLSYLLPKDSILRERMNVLIDRMNQAGLPDLWRQRTIEHRARKMNLIIADGHTHGNDEFVSFNMSDMQTSFMLLGFGLFFATVAFLNEIGWLKLCFYKMKGDKLVAKIIRCIRK